MRKEKMEYIFVKLEPGFFSGNPKGDYKEIIKEHAREGWRLVQIFAPGTGPAFYRRRVGCYPGTHNEGWEDQVPVNPIPAASTQGF